MDRVPKTAEVVTAAPPQIPNEVEHVIHKVPISKEEKVEEEVDFFTKPVDYWNDDWYFL